MPTAYEFYIQEVCVSCIYWRHELCLRYPPIPQHRNNTPIYGECPIVPAGHWCGEHLSVDSIKEVEERLQELKP